MLADILCFSGIGSSARTVLLAFHAFVSYYRNVMSEVMCLLLLCSLYAIFYTVT